LQLAAALASADRLRVLLADGFADRDRALESLNALLTEAARTESARAERAADALAERTLALGEALASAAGVRNLLDEGLADRERSFEAMRALVSERDRALEEARTVAERASRHAEQCLEEALGDEVRRGEALLEKRTLQLADSLAAAAHTRATMIDVLRIYREAFELLHARHGADRRAALRAPNVVRRAAGRLAREAKARFPAPLVRFAGSALRRTRRA
jgi:hypothetical protein